MGRKGTRIKSDPLWYLDYYDPPSHLKPPPSILSLPNELLAAIASYITQNRHLCSLSLVNQRLRHVAQGALVKPVILPQNGIQKLVDMLLDRPDLAMQINHLDLGDFGADGRDTGSGDWDAKTFAKCSEVVTKLAGAEQWSTLVLGKEDADRRNFFLAVLTIISPNLKTLSVESRPLTTPLDFLVMLPPHIVLGLQEFGPLFLGPTLQLLQEKLEGLTIAENSSWKGLHTRNISFDTFSRLKRLSLPIDVLVSKGIDATDPAKVLPPNLECLEIRACNKFLFEWFLKLSECLDQNQFRKLHQVDLYFKHCLRTSLLLLDEGKQYRLAGFFAFLVEMALNGCSTTAYSRNPLSDEYKAADLLEEVQAYTRLTLSEICMASTKDEQFSIMVARDNKGFARRRTKLERKLYLRNPQALTALFTSPTFEGAAWADVRFFNGIKGTKIEYDERFLRKEKKGQKGQRSPAHQDKRRGSSRSPSKSPSRSR